MGLTGWAIAASAFGVRPDSGLPRATREENSAGSQGGVGEESEINFSHAAEAHNEAIRFGAERGRQIPE